MLRSTCLILIFLFSLSPAARALQVMIDPGHGGIDAGTTHSQLKEKDLVLYVAQYLRALIEDDPQFSVQMTRENDRHVSLKDRVKKAESTQTDLFVSLHVNSNPDPRAKGAEFYFQNSLPPDEESLILADQENQNELTKESSLKNAAPSKKSDVLAILEDLHRQHRVRSSLKMTQILVQAWKADPLFAPTHGAHTSIKQAPFFVVSRTTMPSVLIELGFLTHPEESKKLSSTKYQQEVAQKIYKALLQYKEMMDKSEGQSIN